MKLTDIDRKTTLEDFLTLKKNELVIFLRQNNEKISGNKTELATRAFNINQILHGANDSIDNDKPQCDSNAKENNDIPLIAELRTGWSSDENLYPKICHKDVETYLINSRSSDDERMQCYRQFIRGFNFFKENHIHNIMVNKIDDTSKFCYVRSKCYPSMKTGKYELWLLISKEKPFTILRAHCTCPAGLGEACTHVAGLLFALEANSTKQNEIPCTSKQCNWDKGGKRKKEAKEVSEISFKKFRHGEESCGASRRKEITLESNAKNDFFLSLTSRLGNCSFRPVLFDLLPAEKEPYDINNEINVGRFEEVITSETVVLESDKYLDITLNVKKENIVNCQELNRLLTNLPQQVVDEIEKRTIGQTENSLWGLARKCRITSSNFHDIITRKKENVEKLVTKFTNEISVETPALCHGKKYEKIARKKYIAYKKLHQNEKVAVRECGLFLCRKFGYLGASPDGIVWNTIDTCRDWILEIKCPYKWRFKTIRSACEDNDFCLEVAKNGNIQLKKSHRYYAQIQGQLAICQRQKCELVIFLFKDFLILEIEFDQEYWNEAEIKLVEFYNKHIIPEIFESVKKCG